MRIFAALIVIVLFTHCNEQNEITNNEGLAPIDTTTLLISDTLITEISSTNGIYEIITKNDTIPGAINKIIVRNLPKKIKAMAAFYSAMGGTMCDGEACELTTALGLGKQGSDEYKYLICEYFPDDKVAAVLLKQDCYLRPSGASTFSDYEYLTITDSGDTVTVNYNLMFYNRGETEYTEGSDIYLFKDNAFKKLVRNLWTHADN